MNSLTTQQNKEKKRLYDIEYRKRNKEKIKLQKAANFKRTYDPVKAAVERKKNMNKHIEYCRKPEYKKLKKSRDKVYRAKKFYGDFWECAILLQELKELVIKLVPDIYERAKMRGTVSRMVARRTLKRRLLNGQ